MWSPHTRDINWEDSHKTLKAGYKHVSDAMVKNRTSELKMQPKNCFVGTTTTVGFHSWVMPRKAPLFTQGGHRLLAKQREGRTYHSRSLRREMSLLRLELQGEDLFSTSPRPAGKSGHVCLENNEEQ